MARGQRGASRAAPSAHPGDAGSRLTRVAASRACPHQSDSGSSWQKATALLGAVDLEPEAVLAVRRDLADDRAADRAAVGLELHDRGVLGVDRALLAAAVAAGEGGAGTAVRCAAGTTVAVRASKANDAVAGGELGEVAPVRADVRERARRPAEACLDAPVVSQGEDSQSCR